MAKVVLSVRPSCICGGGIAAALRFRIQSSSSSSCSRVGVIGLNQRSRRRVSLAPIAAATTIYSTKPNNSHLMMMKTVGKRSFRASSSAHNNNHHHHVNDSGSIDSPLINSMQTKIKEQLNAESVIVKDAYGDGRHVSIDVISSVFEGESAVSRQRMVYKAIWEELQNTVHAVDQMTTKTPSEAATNK